jgi:hypothetical protein
MNYQLRSGDLAYYDSFAGLIACRVQRITGTSGVASTQRKRFNSALRQRGTKPISGERFWKPLPSMWFPAWPCIGSGAFSVFAAIRSNVIRCQKP